LIDDRISVILLMSLAVYAIRISRSVAELGTYSPQYELLLFLLSPSP